MNINRIYIFERLESHFLIHHKLKNFPEQINIFLKTKYFKILLIILNIIKIYINNSTNIII